MSEVRGDRKRYNQPGERVMPHYVSGTFPPSLERHLANCPKTGSGTRAVHRYLLEVGNYLRHYVEIEDARDLLHEATRDCGRRVSTDEINRALQKAYGTSSTPEEERQPRHSPDVNLIEQIVAERIGTRSALGGLRKRSPEPMPNTAEILAALFDPGSLICAASEFNRSATRLLEEYTCPERYQFIVPSPMSSRYWTDVNGRQHARGNANIGQRRFIVTDFDIKPTKPNGSPSIYAAIIEKWNAAGVTIQDAAAALISYLADAGPLTMVVYSGNVSLQGWWYCQGESESLSGGMRAFFETAVILGADSAGWTRCQLFRMPGARRVDAGRRQDVVFFNPSAIL
jgi:hypothetical protein